jgi:hypothetical protein
LGRTNGGYRVGISIWCVAALGRLKSVNRLYRSFAAGGDSSFRVWPEAGLSNRRALELACSVLMGKNDDHLKCQSVLVTVSVLLTATYWPSGDTGTILLGITTKR